MKEAQFLAQLTNHDMKNINVVRYEESFIDRDNLCIVMELCEGDLDTEIKKHKASGTMYTEDEIMETFVQVLMGLAHIHNNRILHRGMLCKLMYAPAARMSELLLASPCCCSRVPIPLLLQLADLKAQNIFLGKGGIVKLGDLGIAKLVESTLEQCKSFVGTPYYMCDSTCN